MTDGAWPGRTCQKLPVQSLNGPCRVLMCLVQTHFVVGDGQAMVHAAALETVASGFRPSTGGYSGSLDGEASGCYCAVQSIKFGGRDDGQGTADGRRTPLGPWGESQKPSSANVIPSTGHTVRVLRLTMYHAIHARSYTLGACKSRRWVEAQEFGASTLCTCSSRYFQSGTGSPCRARLHAENVASLTVTSGEVRGPPWFGRRAVSTMCSGQAASSMTTRVGGVGQRQP